MNGIETENLVWRQSDGRVALVCRGGRIDIGPLDEAWDEIPLGLVGELMELHDKVFDSLRFGAGCDAAAAVTDLTPENWK